MADLLTTLTPDEIDERITALLAAHAADPDPHGLDALRAQVTLNTGTIWLQTLHDSFDRANGAPGTATTGQVWRHGLGTTSLAITGNKLTATGGAPGIILTDLAGHQTAGITTLQASIERGAGAGDAWLYAAWSEGTPSGVVCQRGSDRVRVGTQLGGTVTWAREYMVNQQPAERLTLILDATAGAATVYLDGAPVLRDVPLPAWTRGPSVGVRLSGTATADNVYALRQVRL